MRMSQVIGFLAGVGIGVGGYHLMSKPTTERCTAMYQSEITDLEQKYASIPTTSGVAGPKDFSIDYVVSDKAQFKGLVFSDNSTGRQGFVTKTEVFGRTSLGLQYEKVDDLLQSANAQVPQPLSTKSYASSSAQANGPQ